MMTMISHLKKLGLIVRSGHGPLKLLNFPLETHNIKDITNKICGCYYTSCNNGAWSVYLSKQRLSSGQEMPNLCSNHGKPYNLYLHYNVILVCSTALLKFKGATQSYFITGLQFRSALNFHSKYPAAFLIISLSLSSKHGLMLYPAADTMFQITLSHTHTS